MKRREISEIGRVNNAGKLEMFMGQLNEFFQAHKNERVVARFQVSPKRSSAALKGYYFNYIVPTFQNAIYEGGERLTKKATEERLREMSPVMHDESVDEETGKYSTRIKGISELSNAEFIEHIETLKQIGAEDYNIYIEDPKVI